MSLYSALYAGVSGLSANASAMAGVADNITNVDTVGYKAIDTQFASLVTDGRTSSAYVAGGVQAMPRALIAKQGLLQASSSSTDLAIDGNGFFVTQTAPDGTGQVAFTRAGSFQPDKQGYLNNGNGYYLYGWPLDANGNYASNGTIANLQPVRLSSLSGTATATSTIGIRANLQSDAPVYAGTYAVGNMASGTATPQFTRSLDVYDAQGTGHTVNMDFLKTGANQWAVEVHAVPATDVTAANGILAAGTLHFNADGSLDQANSTPALFQSITPAWTNGAGSSPVTLSLGTDKGIDGITQFAAPSALISSTINGGLLGNVTSVAVSKDGVVSAVFQDGTQRKVFQLPVATFSNPDGLDRLPGNAFSVSEASGNYVLNQPGVLGSGNIASNSLEASTVDLATEFSNMIRFQRAYSASSKIITTVDDMLQEVSNLKR